MRPVVPLEASIKRKLSQQTLREKTVPSGQSQRLLWSLTTAQSLGMRAQSG